jgi:hypothetical protein
MRVHIPRLGLGVVPDLPVTELEEFARIDRIGRHEVTADPDSADLILFPQCHMLPTDWRLNAIRSHAVTARYRGKVMVYDERDRPWCGFPGVYVSMPKREFDGRFQRSWGYRAVPPADSPREPDLLFSLIGSPSHRCRRQLFELRHPDAVVEQVRGFTFYDSRSADFDSRRERFRETLLRSRFVLCPRGKGTSSIRLYETLAAGRVPVIVADDWVAAPGPDWERFSIRWPEGRTNGLIDLLEGRDRDWPAMSNAAAKAYRDFFAPDVWFHNVVDLCSELRQSVRMGDFPRAGRRDRAFISAGADVARWRTTSPVRRGGRRFLRYLGFS